MACDALGIPPNRCLYVGDGEDRELFGAREVGMAPVLIRVPNRETMLYGKDADEWPGPVISSLTGVLALLD